MSNAKSLGASHEVETAFTINDITLVPETSKLRSRSEAKLHPFIYSAPMDTVTGFDLTWKLRDAGHCPVVSRFISKEERISCLDFLGQPDNNRIWFAIGLDEDPTFMAKLEMEATHWATKANIALDIAHGDSRAAYDYIIKLRAMPFIGKIMSGSICTPRAAVYNVRAGATHLRIGVGPGAACSTRIMTGFGVPQASTVASIHQHLKNADLYVEGAKGSYYLERSDITLIADGGIKEPGDAAKYLSLGADAVMLGSVFSKARESAGWVEQPSTGLWEEDDGEDYRKPSKLTKQYRGQASAQFQEDILGHSSACPEGVSLPTMTWDGKTTVKSIVDYFEGGMRSAVSYAGLTSSSEFRTNPPKYVFVTPSGQLEATPHGLRGI